MKAIITSFKSNKIKHLFFLLLLLSGKSIAQCSPPTIVYDPINSQTICEGGFAYLFIQAEGTDLTYQWKKDGVPVPGANSDNLILSDATSNDAGYYTCLVTGSCGSVESWIYQNLIKVNTAPVIQYNSVATNYLPSTAITPIEPTNSAGQPILLSGAAVNFGPVISNPGGVVIDASGNLFVADTDKNSIRKITPNGDMYNITGSFNKPQGLAVDAAGNVYVADTRNNAIKKIAPDRTVTTVSTAFIAPYGIAIDTFGNLFVTSIPDYAFNVYNSSLKKMTPSGNITTLFTFEVMGGIAVDATGTVYFTASSKLFKITPNGSLSILFFNGMIADGICSNVLGQIYVYQNGVANRINSSGAILQSINAGLFGQPKTMTADALGNVYTTNYSGIVKFAPDDSFTIIRHRLSISYGACKDNAGNLYFSNTNFDVVYKVDANGNRFTYSGFNGPCGLVADAAGNVYVADAASNSVKRINTDGSIITIGSGFNNPQGLAIDGAGTVYVSDAGNNAVKKIAPDGTVTLLANLTLSPYSIAVSPSGLVYVTDGSQIQKILPDGTVSEFISQGINAKGMTMDSNGNLFVSDLGDNCVKVITFNGAIYRLTNYVFFPTAITFDKDGNIIVVEQESGFAKKIGGMSVFSITPSLPEGLHFDTISGSISGTPTVQTPSTTYTVSTQNDCSTASASFAFSTLLPCEPSFSEEPFDNYICSAIGSQRSLQAVTNLSNPTYVWQYQTSSTAPWTTITNEGQYAVYHFSGFTTADLTITKMAATNTVLRYRLIVTGDCGTSTSRIITIGVLSTVKAGSIASASSVCTGDDITLSLTGAIGNACQWQSAPTSAGPFTDIPDATILSYTLTGANAASDKAYRVIVINGCNNTTATTAVKTITVNPTSVAGTVIGGGTVCSGSSGSLKLAGYTGKIQWEYSTDGISYANVPKTTDAQMVPFGTTSTSSTAATYTVTGISTNLYFRAKVTSGACTSVYTNVVVYTLTDVAVVGTISGGTTVCPATGTTLSLSNATGTITWEKSTNYATATPTWMATTNHSLVYPTGNLTYSSAFRAKVTIGSCSTLYSDLAYVYVVAKPVAKAVVASTTSPTGKTVTTAICRSTVKLLTISDGYVGTIQWQHSTASSTTGFSDISGANGISYMVASTLVSNGVNYFRAVFTNSCGVSITGAAVAVWYKACPDDGNTEGGSISKAVKPIFDVVAYPNPYNDNFHLNLNTTSSAIVSVSVYDMTGKLLDKKAIGVDEALELAIGEGYASGVYTIIVTQGDHVKNLRVVKR
ncbi:virginiamycin B lyase family protein [Flavobacterium phycosphaerae]|uniref:virginiamycin B lyase family protein n=1 Tax=Flavobacterium phycosphaerae TaxID=2697515 RepID=UPI00138AB7CC|nr:T9SS type A sorting domain-containing protein [Flavobacterium phycosphaerae]